MKQQEKEKEYETYVKEKTPVIVQTSCGTANYIGHKNLVSICKSMADEYGAEVVLHLDHAKDYDEIRKAIDAGYSSVMFDGSSLPLKENILGTKRCICEEVWSKRRGRAWNSRRYRGRHRCCTG